MAVALVLAGGQGLKDGFEPGVDAGVATHHERVAMHQTPDAAAGAGVEKVDSFAGERLAAPHGVLVVGVAAVDYRVAGFEQPAELINDGVGDGAGGEHDPYGAGSGKAGYQIVHRVGGHRSARRAGCHRLGVLVKDDHGVAAVEQPLGHVCAHAAQADHSQFQVLPPDYRVWVKRRIAAAGSPDNRIETARRPNSRKACKSPEAWASARIPKLNGQSGICTSSSCGWVNCRNIPVSGPPL